MDFGEVHKLVGGVRTGAVAGTELERWRIDQRLIGGSWRSVGGTPQRQPSLYYGVRNINLRWAKAHRTAGNIALDVLLDELEHLLQRVGVGKANIHHKRAAVGHHVVLRSGVYHGYAHLYLAQIVGHYRESVGVEPLDILYCLEDGVNPFVAGSVTRLAVRYAIEHHQPLLGNS